MKSNVDVFSVKIDFCPFTIPFEQFYTEIKRQAWIIWATYAFFRGDVKKDRDQNLRIGQRGTRGRHFGMDVLMPHELDLHGPLRRGGGGSGAPIVVPLGFMLIALALCSLIAFRVKQSNLMVALTLGVIAGGTGLSKELKPFEMDASIKSLPGPLVDALVES